MLELKKITKNYPAGDGIVRALRGIDLKFRTSEFVSILGPSGCGKTTMLNIIGGLDKYTDGDLFINGTSTKFFKDRDWDSYRNHSIGFVFQSYNLIPHQTVLQNVELALTLSGVSKAERRKRAKQALIEVGLDGEFNKRPGEMSGGQMQRVAIARALVNNPDIILADEPTGALDTETSIQVMDILKEISKNKLVIMVTHNPELAEKYSTRIIKMLDGEIKSDSMPLTEDEIQIETKSDISKKEEAKKAKKPSMSVFTSFGLSLKNLFTKKGRTVLTSFAGSIGIIGIALIYAVSQGLTTYINVLQEDTLSSYPITLESQHMDISSILESFMGVAEESSQHENNAVYQKAALHKIINALNSVEASENDLKAFKNFLEDKLNGTDEEAEDLKEALSGIKYSYDLDMLVYTKNVDGEIIRSDATQLFTELMSEFMGMNMMQQSPTTGSNSAGGSNIMSMMSMGQQSTGMWQEMLSGDGDDPINDLLRKQYDIIGNWPTKYNEIVLVVDENNEIDDLTLYALGLKSEKDIREILSAAMNGDQINTETQKWSYDEIFDMEFRTILNSNCYRYDENEGRYVDLRDNKNTLSYLYENAIPLKVTGIIRPNEDAVSTMLTGSIGYTSLLTKHIIENSQSSPAIDEQKNNPHKDIFTGLPFKETTGSLTNETKESEFRKYIALLDESKKANAYVEIMSIPTDEFVNSKIAESMQAFTTKESMEKMLLDTLSKEAGTNIEELKQYLSNMSEDNMRAMIAQFMAEQIKTEYAAGVKAQLSSMTNQQLSAMLDQALPSFTSEMCAVYYDKLLTFSTSTYEDNLTKLGHIDLEKPSTINLYASSFANKDLIEEAIADYNADRDEYSKIKYTDYIGIMLSSITLIINAITYILIAFVAISLIVSSIMIGVITLISVQERTKEIGILRAIGASKKNVSGMFNAETVIIGFTSGLIGVLVTYLLTIPINIIIHHLTGIYNLSAYLPVSVAVVLVVISMLLTLISGIIPSKSAAKKDPVVALRTE